MSLIDYTYFIRDISVPIVAASSSDTHYVKLNDSITRYENDVLKSLLGYTYWKEMTDAYAKSILDKEDENYAALPTKWDELINGTDLEFEYYGRTVTTYWNGLINSDKISLLAYYVYFYHRLYGQTSYTGLGETKAKGENSVSVSGGEKMIWAWNKMVKLYGEIPRPQVKYKNFFTEIDNYVHYNDAPSAYNFLLANKASYADWIFTPLQKKHNFF